MKLSTKLYAFVGGVVVVAFVVFGFYIYNLMHNRINANFEEAITEYMSNYVKMTELEIEAKKGRVLIANNLAQDYFKSLGAINISSEMVKVGETEVNKWILNGKVVQNNFDVVDYIKSKGIDVATIYQKTPKGYLRVSTNVINKEGKRATGTLLGFDLPVVQAIEKGESYTGRAFVVDSWYITVYEPIKVNGEIKGALFVGVPEVNYKDMSEYFKEKKYFGSGYPYIVDSKGIVTAHPSAVGLDINNESFFKEMVEKKNGVVVYDWKGRNKTQHFRYIEDIDSYVTVGWYTEDYEAIFSELRTVLVIATIIALLAVIGVILIIVRGILKQLGADPKEVQEIANKVAEGDLNISIKMKSGDTSSLIASMDKMVKIVKLMVADTRSLGESATAGKLDVRADVSKFKGEFRELVSGINGTLDAVINPLNVTAEYVDRISKGDIPPKINEEYRGDFNEIKNNLNQCIDAIQLLISDANSLSQSAIEGKLDVRANAGRHQGDFRRIIQGVNDTLDNVIGPLNIAAEYMDRISKGDIPPLITETYNGDFNEIKNNLNTLIDSTKAIANAIESVSRGNLNVSVQERSSDDILIRSVNLLIRNIKELTSDVNMLSANAIKGKLDVRADESRFEGDFQAIVAGINGTLTAVVNVINSMSSSVMIGDEDGNITFVNAANQKLLQDQEHNIKMSLPNFDAKSVLGKNIDVFHKNPAHQKAMLKQLTKMHQAQINLGNGIFKLNISPLNDANGERIAYVVEWINYTDEANFNGDLNGLIDAMKDGHLKARMKPEGLSGQYQTTASGINSMLEQILQPISEAVEALQQMAEGNLSVKVTGDYKGDHAIIKDALNTTVDLMPFKETFLVLQSVAQGDLTRKMEGNYKGDALQLKDAMNATIDSLNELLAQVSVTVDEVTRGAMQVSDASTALSQGATEQAASLEEITSSMSEIGSQTKTNAENANQANILTYDAKEAAEKGNKEMEQLNKAMSEITESSRNISKIIKVIDEIAFQTNLLALNAAVEAARAGRHGKGFAVVAEEVRNLAARSASAAKETSELIENSIKTVENGSMLAIRTGEALEEIKNGSIKAADIVGEIATSSNEQAQAISQINEGLTQIDKVTQTNTASAEESASASEELSGQAAQLKSMLSKFKLNNEDMNNAYSSFEQSYESRMMTGRSHKPSRSLPQYESGEPEDDFRYETEVNPSDIIKLDEDDFGRY